MLESDHSPLLLSTVPTVRYGRRPFRFLKVWEEDRSSHGIVSKAWMESIRGGMEAHRLLRRLNLTKAALWRWNKSSFGLAHEKIRELEAELSTLQFEEEVQANRVMDLEAQLRTQRRCLESIYHGLQRGIGILNIFIQAFS